MDSGATGDNVDPRQKAWEEFARKANNLIDSGELDEQEVDYKLELGREFARARKSVLNDANDWADRLKEGLANRPGHPMTFYMRDDLGKWVDQSPDDALGALRALWKRGNSTVSERIRAFGDLLPDSVIHGLGTRIRLTSVLLMGLDVTGCPPFATETFKNAYSQTGYAIPDRNVDEAELYKHALGFLDQFLKEARARGVPLRHRLDMQSVVWHWRKQSDDLPQLGLPLPSCPNVIETAGGWDEFARRVNELIASDEWYKKEIAPKLEIEGMANQARAAVLTDADNWADLAKKIFTGQHAYYINRDKVRSWIDKSPEDSLQALKASWAKSSLSEELRISAFCERLPAEIISGNGSRLTVAATLLAAYDAKQFPPFSKKKYDKAYKRTGYDPPEQNANEAALYVHALGFLDRFIELARAHGAGLRHRLDAFAVVWHLVDRLPSFSTQPVEPKSLHALADDLLLPPNFLEEICTLLEDKRQVIFQGPPGTGKTYVAQALAECVAGDEDRVTLVQFHPSYAYEDFVRGFRPTITGDKQAGFELRDGPLLRAAQQARNEPEAAHFLIIDEINRGNLAKVFGELYFLLEYRDERIHMQYQKDNEEDFSLPENLYIIGTMNTADRSIALVDLALRRRFYFVEFHPDSEPVKGLLRKWLKQRKLDNMEWVADVVEEANRLLEGDRHAAIGPSYLMKDDLDRKMVERTWMHSVRPYIEERLFADDNRLDEFNLDKLEAKAAQTRKQKKDQEQTDGTGEGNAPDS